MLGLRGVRLGIHLPALDAHAGARDLRGGLRVRARRASRCKPKIMIPLVATPTELEVERGAARGRRPQAVMEEQGVQVRYQFGTMIEIPRAALTADEHRASTPSSSPSAPTT